MSRRGADSAWIRAYAQGRPGLEVPDPGFLSAESCERARADRKAAWVRWHERRCLPGLSVSEQAWYQVLEQARVDTLASADYPGMAANLSLPELSNDKEDPGRQALYRLARKCFLDGSDADLRAEQTWFHERRSLWQRIGRRFVTARAAVSGIDRIDVRDLTSLLIELRGSLSDTAGFARRVRSLLKSLADGRQFNLEPGGDQNLLGEGADTDRAGQEAQEGGEGFGGQQGLAAISRRYPEYRVYGTEFDEIELAQRWRKPEDATRLQELDRMDRREARRLAHRLQRQLQSLRLQQWQFDQDEGLLDSRRLARLVGDSPNRRVFRVESPARVPEASVCFLVDQSGSMRGEAHQLAAQAIDLAVHTLEVCGLETEVLGYTTTTGSQEANPLAQRWCSAGSPPSPGRLTPLRHVVLKPYSHPWRRARHHLGLLLRPDFGRENIDGESLDWAFQRIVARPERRKILVVLSDGVPFDQATVEANGRHFLLAHLQAVIEQIESSQVRLFAVGTGRDVSRLYRDSVLVRKPEQIAGVLFKGIARTLEDRY